MKYIFRIGLILLFTYIICELSYIAINGGIEKYNSHTYAKLNELLINNSNYNLLFMGSSRAHNGINPGIVDSICQTNSYNAGMDGGGNMYESKMMLDAYLCNHPTPKMVALTIDLYSFDISQKIFNYTQYLPFIENQVIDSTISCNENIIPVKLASFLSITHYDDYLKGNAIKSFWNNKNEITEGDFEYKGYLSNSDKYISCIDTSNEKHLVVVSDAALLYLKEIITTCKNNGIQLVFIYAPEYDFNIQKHVSNSDVIFGIINNISAKNHIPYLRYDTIKICKDPRLFTNAGHLNRNGATEYSKILGLTLRQISNNTHGD